MIAVFSNACPVLNSFFPSSQIASEITGADECVPATTFNGDETVAPFAGEQIVTEGSSGLCGQGGVGDRKKSS